MTTTPVTLLNLKTLLDYWLGQSGATGAIAPAAELESAVQLAYSQVQTMLGESHGSIGVKQIATPISWVAGTERYDLPDDFQRLSKVILGWNEAAANRYTIDGLIKPTQRFDYYANSDGQYAYIQLLQVMTAGVPSSTFKIGFVPIPTVSKTQNVMIEYWPRGIDLLDADADEIFPFLIEYKNLIAIKAAIVVLSSHGLDYQLLVPHLKLEETRFQDNISNYQDHNPQTLDDVEDYFCNE
jgi:hypothetical protein